MNTGLTIITVSAVAYLLSVCGEANTKNWPPVPREHGSGASRYSVESG